MAHLIYESRKQELINKHRVRERSSRGREVIILAGSAMLSFLVYGRGLLSGFVAEDFNMLALSTVDWVRLCRFLVEETRIKPLSLLLNRAIYPLFGTNPVGYHLMSLVLQAACTWCVVQLGTLLSGKRRVGFVAGLLFAVYPRHHQAVLWLAANQFLIVTLFGLVALICFSKYLKRGERRYYLATWVCSLLALATNEAGVVLLLLMPFLEWVLEWPTFRQASVALRDGRTYRKYWPLLVLMTAFLLLTFGGVRLDKLTVNRTYHFTGWGGERVRCWASYLVYLTFPQLPLRSLDVTPLTVALATLVTLGLGAALAKGTAVVRFLVIWIGAALAPYVFFVPFGNADRYFYVPAIGLSILASILGCWGYDKLKARSVAWARMVAVFLMGLYLISSVILMQQRISEWRRAGEIAEDVVEQTKRLHPNVPPESTMLFVALPDQYKQAYVFLGGGIGGAVYLAYGAQPSAPRAYRTRDPAVSSFLKDAEPADHPLPGLYVFLYEEDTLYDKSNVVNGLEPLREGTWTR
jgi:hypothetical protein